MKPMKFKKIKDEHNELGWDEIIIFERQIAQILRRTADDRSSADFPGMIHRDIYWYTYITLADGDILNIDEDDWFSSMDCYKFVEFC